jgi:hypothetical protein
LKNEGPKGQQGRQGLFVFFVLAVLYVLVISSEIPPVQRHPSSGHTFLWTNAAGEVFWVKYHLRTGSGGRLLLSSPYGYDLGMPSVLPTSQEAKT